MTSWPQGNVLVPIDFSDESFHALDQALEIVGSPSQVLIVHVLQDLPPNEPGLIWSVVDKESRVRHVKEELSKKLHEDKYAGAEVKVLIGDPGHEIAKCAEENKVGLIVMPSHGRTGLKRLMIGSVAERVIRLAHCPVLVLRK
jgi:nucleotide-binding universal stress UspA family protein